MDELLRCPQLRCQKISSLQRVAAEHLLLLNVLTERESPQNSSRKFLGYNCVKFLKHLEFVIGFCRKILWILTAEIRRLRKIRLALEIAIGRCASQQWRTANSQKLN